VSLIKLVEYFVAHPDKLEAFKQDPEGYIKSQKPTLRPQLRALLRDGITGEIGTVMKLNVAPKVDQSTIVPRHGPIHFAEDYAFLTSRTTFFAEKPRKTEGRLLQHSYIAYEEIQGGHKIVAFNLHLLYIDPEDPTDLPQVLSISSKKQQPRPNYNLGDVQVQIEIEENEYALVPADFPLRVQIKESSKFNPYTGALELSLKRYPLPPIRKAR
jgi:hypothetical protein